MKATKQTPPAFTPIVLTLETQAEVDAVFAFLNHTKLSSTAGIPEESECWEALEPFRSEANTDRLHEKLCRVVNL